ncbi:flagellin [Kordiimonas gwangyangensis]|uniref:flagellin n=1 Tax=Kordiimonas gwangyangensis TaxID=288022 RepID=UPI00037E52B7|nr:flagellin [Kordiimonas gwangyangensis]
MVDSINTNAGSLQGVRSLQKSNSLLRTDQKELASGKKVNDAKDNAAILAISKLLESDVAGLGSVKNSLDRAISTSDVALSAGQEVSSLLLNLKEKAVKAADPGLDDASRQALNNEFTALRDQIDSIVGSAEFNGTNALKAGGNDIVAISEADGGGSLTIQAQDLSLGGDNVALSATQGIGTLADAQAAVSAIEDSLVSVSNALSEIGAGSSRLQQTKDFTETLSNKTQEGIGNLVDANLATTNANFEANQVRQALGIQSLSIANRQPAAILTLFQN